MQLYVDTSALVKLVVVEAESAALRSYFEPICIRCPNCRRVDSNGIGSGRCGASVDRCPRECAPRPRQTAPGYIEQQTARCSRNDGAAGTPYPRCDPSRRRADRPRSSRDGHLRQPPSRRRGRLGIAVARPTASEQVAIRRRARLQRLDVDVGGLHPLEQTVEVGGRAEFDADQRLAGLAVVALDVLEQRDVVVGRRAPCRGTGATRPAPAGSRPGSSA